ncbi:MAG: hypothetical protein U0S36_06055 [Candidatus Nanopelagicales bacterium]
MTRRATTVLVAVAVVGLLALAGVGVARWMHDSSVEVAGAHARLAADALQSKLDAQVPASGTDTQLDAAFREAVGPGFVVRRAQVVDGRIQAVVQLTLEGNSAILTRPNPSQTATICVKYERAPGFPFSRAELPACPP